MSLRGPWGPGALVACGVVLVAPVATWLSSVGNPVDYFQSALPPGQALYALSKLAGLLAFSLLWLQGLLALARRVLFMGGLPPVSYGAHRGLGLALVATVLLHFGLFFSAASIRAGSPAWGLWVPHLTGGSYEFHVSLGLVALWLLLVGVLAGWRSRRGGKRWRMAHQVWLLAFMLVFLHGFGIGSESRLGAMRYVFLFVAVSLSVAVLARGYRAAWGARSLDAPLQGDGYGASHHE
jgi:predicted ferric reductase